MVELFKTDQLEYELSQLVVSQSGEQIYCPLVDKVAAFTIIWSSMSRFSNKVRGIALRSVIDLGSVIEALDVDFFDRFLVVQMKKDPTRLLFYRQSDFREDPMSHRNIEEVFSLKLNLKVSQFGFSKQAMMEGAKYSNFLFVQTSQSLVIFRESLKGVFEKVFSISGMFDCSSKVQFCFFADNEENPASMMGCVFYLSDSTLVPVFVKNLQSESQTQIEEVCYKMNCLFPFDSLSGITVNNIGDITALFSYEGKVLVSISFRSSRKGLGKVKALLLSDHHVDSPYFIYSQSSPFIFGHLRSDLQRFDIMQRKLETKNGFRSLEVDWEAFLKKKFWILLDSQNFLVFDPFECCLQLFRILGNNNVSLNKKVLVDFLRSASDNSNHNARFIALSRSRLALVIETSECLRLYEIRHNLQLNELSMKQLIELPVSESLSNKSFDFYQVIYQSVPKRIFKLFILRNSSEIEALEIDPDNGLISSRLSKNFSTPVRELYKCKKFPYNLVLLDQKENLVFLNNQLQQLLTFPLSQMRQLIPESLKDSPILENVSFKHLYDRFYVVS